ncbi:hypothetical protein BCF55_0763 [Hydrogenivirga caldilitoris]|uniref:Uncharacterized protein n=1 Tax=Hydrogenivirga caldilitoris TaxID=246264 RepID=A0A497XNP3_9AQUI|nr:hypothetical protein [Hydrogenivirga caldilitoris]RLJ70488.1 hypothetical protein BCF55_0763 [Hydrogenivirga caldilitoris]
MGKIVQFPSQDGDNERKGEGKELKTERLSQEEFMALLEPFRDGLRRLYPTQVKDILGIAGFGKRYGNEVLIMGLLLWESLKQSQPIMSTFLAVFIKDRLEKVSFLEAKNNYWDWKLMLETYQSRFNTKEMFEELQNLREQVLGGNPP